MRGQSIAKIVMFVLLLGVAGVLAFFCVQDSDGDWQVKGSFTKGWAARTVGFTGLGALVFLVLAVGSLRPARAKPDQAEPSQTEPDQAT